MSGLGLKLIHLVLLLFVCSVAGAAAIEDRADDATMGMLIARGWKSVQHYTFSGLAFDDPGVKIKPGRRFNEYAVIYMGTVALGEFTIVIYQAYGDSLLSTYAVDTTNEIVLNFDLPTDSLRVSAGTSGDLGALVNVYIRK